MNEDKPRNPFATEDFANAIKKAAEDLSKELGKIGEQIQKNVAEDKITFMDFADMDEEYSGVMRMAKSEKQLGMLDTE